MFSTLLLSLATLAAPVSSVHAAVLAGAADGQTADQTGDATDASRPKQTALEAFKKRHETVLLFVRSKLKPEVIQKEVDQLLDYEWIATTAMGGKTRADRRCEPRCAEFEELLTRLIRENYLKRISHADRGNIEYVGEERRPRASKVTTLVRFTRNGRPQTLEIAYIMHVVGGRWVVRDIVTEGVSLVKNYRYEFNKIFRSEGIDGLVARLQTKLAEVAKAE